MTLDKDEARAQKSAAAQSRTCEEGTPAEGRMESRAVRTADSHYQLICVGFRFSLLMINNGHGARLLGHLLREGGREDRIGRREAT